MLLGGWLYDRLDLPATSIARRSAGEPAIELTASGRAGGSTAATGGRAGRFSVACEKEDGFLTGVAELEGGRRHHDAVRLPDDPLAAGLTDALTSSGHDEIYERAVGAALDTHR